MQSVFLKTQASQFSNFYLKSHSHRPSTSGQLYCGSLVYGRGMGDGVLGPCLAKTPWGSRTAQPGVSNTLYLLPLCLQTALLIQPWEVFDLAVSSPPFFGTRPECSSSHPRCNPSSGGLRTGWEHQPGQRVLLDHVQVASPLLVLETGGLLFAFFMQFSLAVL